jgi:predicted RNase H-like HicB family nuclease
MKISHAGVERAMATKPRAGRRRAARASFTVRIYPGEDGFYVAYCKELPGCVSQGKTVAEAKENIREAMVVYLETLSERAGVGRGKSPEEGERRPVRVARFSLEPLGA